MRNPDRRTDEVDETFIKFTPLIPVAALCLSALAVTNFGPLHGDGVSVHSCAAGEGSYTVLPGESVSPAVVAFQKSAINLPEGQSFLSVAEDDIFCRNPPGQIVLTITADGYARSTNPDTGLASVLNGLGQQPTATK